MPQTTNIALSVPAHGSNVDTWDADPVNNNSGILDACFGGVTSKSLTNVDVTLSATEARVNVLRFSGTLSGNVKITPSTLIKSWVCENNTLGNFTVKMANASGNVVALPPGSSQVYWDGTNFWFINLGVVGSYMDYASAALPLWVSSCTIPPYLICDGTTFSAGTYPLLNAILGGNTLPDFRGRSRAFLNGGTNRITTAGSGIDGDTRFSAGGAQNVALDVSTLPAHDHGGATGATDVNHQHNANSYGFAGATGAKAPSGADLAIGITGSANTSTSLTSLNHQHGISAQGGGAAHNNMQPTAIGGITMIRAA